MLSAATSSICTRWQGSSRLRPAFASLYYDYTLNHQARLKTTSAGLAAVDEDDDEIRLPESGSKMTSNGSFYRFLKDRQTLQKKEEGFREEKGGEWHSSANSRFGKPTFRLDAPDGDNLGLWIPESHSNGSSAPRSNRMGLSGGLASSRSPGAIPIPVSMGSVADVMAAQQQEEPAQLDFRAQARDERRRRNLKLRDEKIARDVSSLATRIAAPKRAAPVRRKTFTAREVQVGDAVSVRSLAVKMGERVRRVVFKLRELGEDSADEHSTIGREAAELVVAELGHVPVYVPPKVLDVTATDKTEDLSHLPLRPPVVCVMGHVDHGKTTLLSALRQAKAAVTEAGGITQKISAFQVPVSGRGEVADGFVTILDTPGHAAFANMRASTAAATDVVLLVVAGDDGLRPQTLEVLRLVSERNVALMVAVTKTDIDGVDEEEAVERVQQELHTYGVVCEKYGGEVMVMPVSGLTSQGVPELLDGLLLQSDVLDLRADPHCPAEGCVIEATVEKGLGACADVLLNWGTLKPGDHVVVGENWGKVKAVIGCDGRRVKKAGPGCAVRVSGLSGLPQAGDVLLGVGSREQAVAVCEMRQQTAQDERDAVGLSTYFKRRNRWRPRLSKSQARIASGERYRENVAKKAEEKLENAQKGSLRLGDEGFEATEVTAIIRADSAGVITALRSEIALLPTDEVYLTVLNEGVTAVTEADVEAASQSGALIMAFNCNPSGRVVKKARTLGVRIVSKQVIYHLMDEVREVLSEKLHPNIVQKVEGVALVQQVFVLNGGAGTVAGCTVRQGKITAKGCQFRVKRDGVVVYEVEGCEEIRHFKDVVQQVEKGQECGLLLSSQGDAFQDYMEGDVIEAFTLVEEKRRIA